MAQRPRVSLNVIARNEAANLRAAVEPVRALFDEFVLVDTGSSDGTPALAREFGAAVHELPWANDFSAARNAALERSTGDWVMWLDGDDRLDPPEVAKLAALRESLRDEPRAFVFRCANVAKDGGSPTHLLHHVRLFPRRDGVRWERRVHEQILPALLRAGCTSVPSGITVRHLGYGDPATDQRKAQRNLRLLRLEYATDPTDAVTLFHLGLTHLQLGQFEAALGFLQSSRKAATGTADWIRSLFAHLRDALQAAGRVPEALAAGEEGLARFPGDPVLTTAHSALLVQLGDVDAAERFLTRLLERPAPAVLANGSERTLDLREARHMLGTIDQERGRIADAERRFRALLAEQPGDLLPGVSLGYVLLAQNRGAEVEEVARQIDATGADPAYGLVMRAELAAAQGRFADALALVDRAAARAPRFPWARVVRANVLMRAGAERAACLAAWRDVQRLSPECVRTARTIAALEGAERSPPASAAAAATTLYSTV